MEGYRELMVWQKGMDLVVAVYRLTATFPKSETFGLASQMQRAAVSVPSNIAEGNALRQTKAYLRHLAIASGSLAELETQLEIAERLGYSTDCSIASQANEIGRMLTVLRKNLEAKL